MDSIRFIPLEIKEGVQSSQYNEIIVTKNHFLMVDFPNKAVFLYTKDGKFANKINYKKLGENFYPGYNELTNQIVFFGNNKNYTLTTKDQLQIQLDWKNPRNKKYFEKYTISLNDTSFLLRKETPTENEIVNAYHFYDDQYWQGRINTSPLYKDSVDYELKIYKNNKLVKAFFPYNRVNEARFLYAQESTYPIAMNSPSIRLVSRPYCDTLYRLNRDSIFPAYHLVFPLENSLPASFYTKPFRNKTERENFNRNNGWMFRQVRSFYETPDFFFFSVAFLSNYESYIYQKQTKVTYKIKNIKPDSSQYNLQLLDNYSMFRNDDRFYRLQKAEDLIRFFEQHKNVAVPKELEDFLKNNPHSSSPIIVEFKLKN